MSRADDVAAVRPSTIQGFNFTLRIPSGLKGGMSFTGTGAVEGQPWENERTAYTGTDYTVFAHERTMGIVKKLSHQGAHRDRVKVGDQKNLNV